MLLERKQIETKRKPDQVTVGKVNIVGLDIEELYVQMKRVLLNSVLVHTNTFIWSVLQTLSFQ